jgi:predicted site-specific integrase-resolvase
VLTTRQAAERLGVTPRQVRRFAKAGLLDAQPLGDYSTAPLVITEESVERLAQARVEDPPRRRRREAVERSAP